MQNQTEMIILRQRIYEKYGNKGSIPGNLYNAVTKYYKCINGTEMERITRFMNREG